MIERVIKEYSELRIGCWKVWLLCNTNIWEVHTHTLPFVSAGQESLKLFESSEFEKALTYLVGFYAECFYQGEDER